MSAVLTGVLTLLAALVVDRATETESGETRYGIGTGWSGIRGSPAGPTPMLSSAAVAAYNRDQAAQGMRMTAMAPPAGHMPVWPAYRAGYDAPSWD